MKKPKRNKEYYEQVLKFILTIDPNNPGFLFNYESDIFKSYVNMQIRFAEEDGFNEAAEQMKNHIK